MKFAGFLLEHNIPIATADHAGSLFHSMFPDRKIASYYEYTRTKTTSVINRVLAPEFAGSVIIMVRKTAIYTFFFLYNNFCINNTKDDTIAS